MDSRIREACKIIAMIRDAVQACGLSSIDQKKLDGQLGKAEDVLSGILTAEESQDVDELLIQEVYSLREKLKIAVAAIKRYDPDFDAQLFTHQLNSVDFDQLMEELGGNTEEAQDGEDARKVALDVLRAFQESHTPGYTFFGMDQQPGLPDAAAIIQAYAARVAARKMQDLTGAIAVLREAIHLSAFCASTDKERTEWNEALDRIVQALKL